MKFTADFETATWNPEETWVWAWATCNIENEKIKMGNNIDSFMFFCKLQKNSTFYFHNLKFDGEFIIYWLLCNGFKHVEKKEDIEDNTFTTLINSMGQFYQITVYYTKGNKKVHKTTFIDSLKIINMSVDAIAKTYGLPISKLKIDYNEERSKGHELTETEKEYIKNDVLIVAKALKILFDQGLDHMTSASNALHDYKKIVSLNKFFHFFPQLELEVDKDIRQAYKGGFTYLNPLWKEKTIENVTNLDVNSLYPSVMYAEKMPIGDPIFFEGKYKEDSVYDLYVQMIVCSFKVKPNHIPTIQLKNTRNYLGNEYLTETNEGEKVCLVLTSIDLKLFLDHYDTFGLEYISGWKFRSINGLFTDYIDKWVEVKNQGTIEKNKGKRATAKLMLNSLYGKFAKALEMQQKTPYIQDGIVKYRLSEPEITNGIYIPVGAFITAYAREKTIRTSQAIKEYSLNKYGIDAYIYSDTDSIKTLLPPEELEKFCDIDDVKLGAWKNEGIAKRGKFIRQKCYLEEFEEGIEITCAGMPKQCYNQVTWDNFEEGLTVGGKLTFKHVRGGVILVETDFTIKSML